MSNRRNLRELALKGLYAYELGSGDAEHILRTIIKTKPSETPESFSEDLFLKVIRLRNECDELIQHKIKNWQLDRVALIDHLIISMGIVEFLEFNDIPVRVTINESIELAKKYSTSKSGNFVNGVLDAVLSDLNTTGKINKKGRGLIDTTVNKKN